MRNLGSDLKTHPGIVAPHTGTPFQKCRKAEHSLLKTVVLGRGSGARETDYAGMTPITDKLHELNSYIASPHLMAFVCVLVFAVHSACYGKQLRCTYQVNARQ